ncbi:sensor histidine kinase [Nocardioides coralli]|nr:sensor histidine kinase [Nocardioides coralli]
MTEGARGATVAAWWPWLALPAAATGLVSAGVVLAAVETPEGLRSSEALVNIPLAIGFSTVAAGIWSTRPHATGLTRLAILYTVVGLASACVLPAYAWGGSVLPGAAASAWVSSWVWALGAAPLLALGLLLYPDGELPGRAWWPVAALGIGGNTALVASGALRPGPLANHDGFTNPIGIGSVEGWERAGAIGFLAVMAAGVAGLVGLLVKFRRAPAGDVRRRQIGGFLTAGVLVVIAAALPQGERPAGVLLALGAGAALPATVGVAVVRHRLLDRRESVEALHRRLDEVSESRRSIVTEREEERTRLRRELHDGLGPSLAAIGLGLRQLERQTAGDQVATVHDLADEVGRAVEEVRRLCDGLRPPAISELGLADALRAGLAPLERFGPTVELVAGDLPPLAPATEVAAYRIVMEAVTNAVRHSDGTRVCVRLVHDDGLHLVVADDGIGLDPAAVPGVGLAGMTARAEELGGRLTVGPAEGAGTEVRAWLPEAGR